MKARFDFTVEDLVDTTERGLGRSRLVRSWRWRSTLVSAGLSGAVVYALVPGAPATRLVLAIVCAVATGLSYPPMIANVRKARLRKLFLERFGGPGPFRFEIELTPEAVVTTQAGTQARYDWSRFSAVEETPEAIELVGRGAGTIAVRNRAFQSQEEWRAFLDTARCYLAARATSPPAPR